MTATYEVTEHPDAIIVRGSLPVSALASLTERAEALGLHGLYPGIAQALHASFVIASPEGAARLQAEIDAKNAGMDAITRWRRGTGTGLSSIALLNALEGRGSALHHPHDPADFGRCHRMLAATGLRDRLPEVRDILPRPWPALIDAWGQLEALYEEELPSGRAPKLCARMLELTR